ncbi:hypothetical protein TNCV_4952751 [Trichonephila clavipes]|nr:hypothetical protein TNCV_4952751 [Trichonephila clavipes]
MNENYEGHSQLPSRCFRFPRQYKECFFPGIEVQVGITFQDGDRFNSCQVIYSQFSLAIHQNDHQVRRRFVEWAQNEIAVVPDFHKRILFSDEAHFWLNGSPQGLTFFKRVRVSQSRGTLVIFSYSQGVYYLW